MDLDNLPQPLALPPALGLDPALFDTSALKALQDFVTQGTPHNTARTYRAGAAYVNAWMRIRLGRDMAARPMTRDEAIYFLLDHLPTVQSDGELATQMPESVEKELLALGVKRNPGLLKVASVENRLAVIGALHKSRDWPSPTDDPLFKTFLRRAKSVSVYAGRRPVKRTAAALNPLQAIISTCGDSMQDLRDAALLWVGFASGGRRRSELAAMRLEDVEIIGRDEYLIRMSLSKTIRDGSSRGKPVRGEAGKALSAWLASYGQVSGPLFPQITRTGKIKPAAIPGDTINKMVKTRAAAAGLPGVWGAHSLRSGFVTEAGRQGQALPEVMAMTDHKSVGTLMGYYQSGNLLESDVSDVAGVATERQAKKDRMRQAALNDEAQD